MFWDGEGDNPYPQFLAHADAFIVPAELRQHDGRAVRHGQARVCVRAGGRLGASSRASTMLCAGMAPRVRCRRVSSGWRPGAMRRSIRPRRSPPRSRGAGSSGARCWALACIGAAAQRGADAMAVPIVPLVVATALFMENTDATILATALPTIARDLGLDPISLKLAVTSYLVSLAVFIPVSGWVADRVGSCTTFRLALDGVHGRLDRLRILELARRVRVLARRAGDGRRHDGAGRAHGGDPRRAQERAGARAVLHRHARADRADAGAAARRA